ncbi:Ankyrin repeat domain containing protein [Pandoravirus quercus]|uniref:Ankyrin repeat domain containing protein n=1 Tax=Pandoravirus quercus TaxID=2107709 RepID=A0A2U7U9R4_9VIRU|nr:Ankyrin repeat domain containing protein [Pandoravirus quercus]AVK75187.1 Ankyrin repeat domain containing protein [Pandoravirus quercus]
MGTVHARLVQSRQGKVKDDNNDKTSGPKSLDDLPDELLVAIAQRLDCMDHHSTMRRVSRRWRAIVSDRTLLGPPTCFRACRNKTLTKKRKKKCLYAHAPTCPRHRLACADAIRAGAGPVALCFLKRLGHKYNKDAVTAAILANDIPCLVLLHSAKVAIKCAHFEAVARRGHVDMLAWLFANESGYSWNSDILAMAARHGHLDCLKLAHQAGVKWDEGVALAAARGGHVDCLAYAHDYGCPWKPMALYQEAKSYGHKACCDYIARHTTEHLPNGLWDSILDVLGSPGWMVTITWLVLLVAVNTINRINKKDE